MKHKKSGFSLVELLIVVAIIGTLASIGIPAYQTYQKKARRGTCTSMLNSCYKAQTLYVTENEEYSKTFQLNDTSLDPNKEIFSPTSKKSYYDLGVSAENTSLIDTNGSGELNYENLIGSTGKSNPSSNPDYISSTYVPRAGIQKFNCVCRGNIDGDSTIDSVMVDQDNKSTIRTNDI